jgi:hypothetical protein
VPDRWFSSRDQTGALQQLQWDHLANGSPTFGGNAFSIVHALESRASLHLFTPFDPLVSGIAKSGLKAHGDMNMEAEKFRQLYTAGSKLDITACTPRSTTECRCQGHVLCRHLQSRMRRAVATRIAAKSPSQQLQRLGVSPSKVSNKAMMLTTYPAILVQARRFWQVYTEP